MTANVKSSYGRTRVIVGLVLACVFYAQYQLGSGFEPIVSRDAAVVQAAPAILGDPFENLIRKNPLEALKLARERHLREVEDYECTMVKQEMLPSGMSSEQEINVKFRQAPYSVLLEWVRNAGLAQRVLYVEGRWNDSSAENPDERSLALCQPGAIAKLFIKSVKQPIRGKLARKTARRSIDEFGFKRALDLLIQYSDMAQQRGELVLTFKGESRFNGRRVWVIRRELPYTGEDGPYPDRVAEVLVDVEYRIPVAVYCYSDIDGEARDLLGKYEYRNIRFDVGLTERDFNPATYGM